MRTGQNLPLTLKGLAIMELLVLTAFFGLLALFSALGWVNDSRDGNDWSPTLNGVRRSGRGR